VKVECYNCEKVFSDKEVTLRYLKRPMKDLMVLYFCQKCDKAEFKK